MYYNRAYVERFRFQGVYAPVFIRSNGTTWQTTIVPFLPAQRPRSSRLSPSLSRNSPVCDSISLVFFFLVHLSHSRSRFVTLDVSRLDLEYSCNEYDYLLRSLFRSDEMFSLSRSLVALLTRVRVVSTALKRYPFSGSGDDRTRSSFQGSSDRAVFAIPV